MQRLTRPTDEPGRYRAEMESVAIAGGTGVGGAAIDRLGRFEDFCEAVAAGRRPRSASWTLCGRREKPNRYASGNCSRRN